MPQQGPELGLRKFPSHACRWWRRRTNARWPVAGVLYVPVMSVWTMRFDPPAGVGGGRVRVGVKDASAVAGVLTTAGCAGVRARGVPATSDARCLAGLRSAGAYIVGKTTLTELCLSPVGDNATFGTP